jgi:sugar phosphate isomerase/epimerase
MTCLRTRRELLAISGAAIGLGLARPVIAKIRSRGGIGLETITVMQALAQDLDGTLRAVRRMGYRNLETIGTLGLDAHVLRDRMKANGLASSAQHLCPDGFYAVMRAWSAKTMSMAAVFEQIKTIYSLDRLPALLNDAIGKAHVLGQQTIICSSILDSDLQDLAGVERIAAAFTAAGKACAAAGLAFGFHNGSKGFTPVMGKRPYDLLLERTDPALVKMEMDVYWARKVGIDPLAYIANNPGRYTLCHLKDMDDGGEIVGIGEGIIDFAEVLRLGDAAGIAHYYVEYDQAPDPMHAAASSLKRLTAMRGRVA